jgi:Kef-type K+ transport system membrane component KefB
MLLGGKVISKIFGLYPVVGMYRKEKNERWYYTLMMSTGLTFGTISAMFGLAHRIVTREQYSFLVAAVIASAVVPTMIANFVFLPRHLLADKLTEATTTATAGEMAVCVAENKENSLADQ